MDPISVLLIDDSPTFLHIAAEFLREQSPGTITIVGTADNARTGLDLAARSAPQIILIDMKMPDLTGLEAIPLLREIVPGSGVIALTLMDTNAYRQAALKAGAHEFIAKDRMHDRLIPAIHRVAAGLADLERT